MVFVNKNGILYSLSIFLQSYKNAWMCRTNQKSIAGRYKRGKHKRIKIKLLLLIFLWLGSRESGTLGDLVNLTFLTLAKGKVIKSHKKLRYPLILRLIVDLVSGSGTGGMGISI